MRRLLTLLIISLLAAWQPARAQKGFSLPALDSGMAWATLHTRAVDGELQVAISIEIEQGWHLYHDDLGNPDAIGSPTEVSLTGAGLSFSEVRFPEPLKLDQPGLGTWIYGHEGTIVLYALGHSEADVEESEVSALLEGLTCEDRGTCIPYEQELSDSGAGSDALFASFPDDLQARKLSVEAYGRFRQALQLGGAVPVPVSDSVAVIGSTRPGVDELTTAEYAAVVFPEFTPQTNQETHGLGMWLLLAFVAGMLLNVMPCVLPVISIKILSFVQQAGEDRGRILSLGLSFAAGIMVVFLVLATLAVAVGLSWGEQFQSQPFIIGMIALVFAFSLSMFGVFELGVPAGVGALAGAAPREGLGDAFFKGMLATVLATPCSGPFLGSTITWTLSQPELVVFAIFTALGLGMALPYVVLTANPRLLKIVPKPGPWMDTFKQSMGFLLLATVVYLMISLRQELMLFTVAFLVFVGLGCWWWGRFSVRARSSGRRLATLVVALGIAAIGWRVSFVDFQGLFASDEHTEWEEFDPTVFAAYLDSGRSVLVDFTADWCPNCKYNEKFVYDDEQVVAAMAAKNVARITADLTHDGARTDMLERLRDSLGAQSIPFVAVFPGDAPDSPHTRFDIVTKADMLGIIDSLPGD
jgi:thiol:disulfide interchange protein